ncbi:hypothetical protein LCGC14_2516250 [marine sediment metagenome]|uniref:RNA ligase domain-containing protein n=1 Tax=marine sediment metagenome TaxID=412755 RepID=A0A0F9DR36_9ZZZZ
MNVTSYPKVYQLGHRAIKDLFLDEISVEEKIDGSQFSFGVKHDNGFRVLVCRSHHQQINLEEIPKMFTKAVETAQDLTPILRAGLTYRCEYLNKPKHNVLAYDRVPKGNLIIFDIERGIQDFLTPEERDIEAKRIGLESVPIFYRGKLHKYEDVIELLDEVSVLGGQQMEGLVFKNHKRFSDHDGKIMVGKFVRESFKELHSKEYKTNAKHIAIQIGESLNTEARWLKAIQHMKEDGTLTDSPKDIGPLLHAINDDVLEECVDSIKNTLLKYHWKIICRTMTRGFPAWYKDQLAKKQFEDDKACPF